MVETWRNQMRVLTLRNTDDDESCWARDQKINWAKHTYTYNCTCRANGELVKWSILLPMSTFLKAKAKRANEEIKVGCARLHLTKHLKSMIHKKQVRVF